MRSIAVLTIALLCTISSHAYPRRHYVSHGKQVRRPVKLKTHPRTRWTTRCKDGSYSFSQSPKGTCSHHGGVSTRG